MYLTFKKLLVEMQCNFTRNIQLSVGNSSLFTALMCWLLKGHFDLELQKPLKNLMVINCSLVFLNVVGNLSKRQSAVGTGVHTGPSCASCLNNIFI